MIIPVLHRILVKQDILEEKDEVFKKAKAAGLQFDFNERNREQAAIDTGAVVAIGATAFKDFGLESSPIKVGDTIVYARHAGKVIEDPQTKEKFVAINDEDVVCVITQEKEPLDG